MCNYRDHPKTDPLVHHGRHFGCTIRMFCRIQALLKQGLALTVQLELGQALPNCPLKYFASLWPPIEQKELRIYKELLALLPHLEERLLTGSEEELFYMADMFTKGVSAARSDNTQTLKSSIIAWITPPNTLLTPPLSKNIKMDRGFYHERTGELLCPATMDWSNARSGELLPLGDQWPLFLYLNYKYNSKNPWSSLLRSSLLVTAYKHIFMSPSSVEKCNNQLTFTTASIAYIATQVRFALSSLPVFSRNDTVTDSENFYNSLLDLMEDPEEAADVLSLKTWWNR
ncbi:hypothetical protein FA15DRAFT_683513 [Coprinopsis marcescibilis]|uniref:Uncharacterized protein n=1 Tax=Coprinopsis marcescibilis TaxID=230819 RepID=A0A5C3KBP3_COPMA|nr:hypothetical protein FA15DRAFT_683513 [Coprinopsis marcescibilis]